MHCDVAIIGGGVGGCVAAGWLHVHRPDWRVIVIEPGPLGGTFKGGGLKYLRWDDSLAQLLNDCGLVSLKQEVKGAVCISAEASPPVAFDYPGQLTPEQIDHLQREHYFKTRGTMAGFTSGVMNFGGRGQWKIATPPQLCEGLTQGAEVFQTMLSRITPSSGSSYLKLGNGKMVEAKTTLWTPHLSFLAKMMGCQAAIHPRARMLNVITCEVVSDWWAEWDYIYTSSVCEVVHRISPTGAVSVSAEWNDEAGLSKATLFDLESLELIPQIDTHAQLPGHLLPLTEGEQEVVRSWREHGILPLGRFAEWDGRATVDRNVYKMTEVFDAIET